MITFVTLKKPNIKDFSESRNNLLKRNNSGWVFFLDSDEKISKELKKELKNFHPKNFNGFYIKRKNYFLGNYIGIDKIVRLGKVGKGKWERRVHEVWKIKGRIGSLSGNIVHNTARNLHEYIDKMNYYSALHATANKVEGKRSTVVKIIFYPVGKFIFTLIKTRNVVFSIMQSFHSFLSWSKMFLGTNQK